MTKNLILVGAGGHAKACIEVIESTKEFAIKGLVDQQKGMRSILGYSILGEDDIIDQQASLYKVAIKDTQFKITYNRDIKVINQDGKLLIADVLEYN